MLRLVHPAPGGQGTDPPTRREGARSPALSLTHDEVRHARTAGVNVNVEAVLSGAMTTDRAALDRLRDRYAAEHGCTLTRMGAARAIIRRGLVDADDRPLSDVLGDPHGAVRPKGGA